MKNKCLLLLLSITLLLAGCDRKVAHYENLKQLEGGKTFAVPTGTAADQFVLKRFPDARIVYYNTVLDCALAVKGGKADAAVYDKPVLKNIAAKNEGLIVLDELLLPDNYGFAVDKQNTSLKAAMDEVLAKLKSNGTYDDMLVRWFPAKGGPAPMPEISFEGAEGVLLFGTSAYTEPMSYFSSDQKIAGFDIEFAQHIAKHLNKKLEIVNMEFGAMLPALISGKVEMVGAGLSITEERAKSVLFSESYYESGLAALVNLPSESATAQASTAENTKQEWTEIGVLMGSIHESYAIKNYPGKKILAYNSVPDMLMALSTGKVQGAFMDHTSVREVLSANENFGLLQSNLFSVDIAAGFNKKSAELREEFNRFLAEIKADGTYDAMVKRWHEDIGASMPEIANPNPVGEINIGIVSDIGLPFAAKSEGQWRGFDVELGSRFGAWSGKRINWIDMPFGSLLPSLVSGKIDIITASLMITEERQKQIDFSDPYYASGVSIIGIKDQHKTMDENNPMPSDFITSNTVIGVLQGSIHELYAIKKFPESSLQLYNTVPDMLIALNSKKIDVAFMGQSWIKEALASNQSFRFLIKNLYLVDIGAGFHKQSAELRQEFNRFLEEIKASGIHQEMVYRWLEGPAGSKMPAITNPNPSGILKVGISGDNGLPFAARTEEGYIGFDVELVSRFAAWSGKKIEWVDMPFGSLLPSMNGRKIDLITASLAITEERQKQIDFSEPYYATGVSLIGRMDAAEQAASNKMNVLDDIADKKVGIFTGTVHDAFMEKKFPRAQVFRFESTADMMLSLKSGKVDAAMFDLITAGLVLKRNPDLGMLTNDVLDMPLGVGFNKKNPGLLNEFNDFLREIKQDGTYDIMHERWFVNDAEEAVIPDFVQPVSDKKLVAGVSVEDLPYVALMNGKYVGFDIEMIQTFAMRRNYALEIITIEFPALVAALSAGKVDLITDGIAISEERAKQINFSDPYAIFRTAVIAHKKNLAKYKDEKTEVVAVPFFQKVSESFYNNIILEKRYLMILRGLSVTIIISVLSAIAGTFLGGLICFMRMSKNRLLKVFASYFISLIRGTPVLVFLMIIYYVVFASVNINPVIVAVIAFGINFAAYVSEMFRSSIEGIDKGQHEAGIASGFTKIKTFIYIIMPQAMQRVLPVYKGEFISLVKMTSIVGYIAVEDLTKASDIIRSRTFDAFFPLIMAAVIYIIIAWLLTLVLDYAEFNVDPKKRRLSLRKEAKQ